MQSSPPPPSCFLKPHSTHSTYLNRTYLQLHVMHVICYLKHFISKWQSHEICYNVILVQVQQKLCRMAFIDQSKFSLHVRKPSRILFAIEECFNIFLSAKHRKWHRFNLTLESKAQLTLYCYSRERRIVQEMYLWK